MNTSHKLSLLSTAMLVWIGVPFGILGTGTGCRVSTMSGGTACLIVKDAETAATIPDCVIEEEHWHIGLSWEGHGEGPTGGEMQKTLRTYRFKSGEYITASDVTKDILIPFGRWTGLINNGVNYTIWAEGYFPMGMQDADVSRSARSGVPLEMRLRRSHPENVADQRVLAGCAIDIRDNLLPTTKDPLLRKALLKIAIEYFETLLSEPIPAQMQEGRRKAAPPFGDQAHDSLPKLREMLASEAPKTKLP